MASIDPTTVRLSDTLLLSDAMGCDSVYRYGFRNRIDDTEEYKIEEARNLASTLDEIQEDLGPISVCYGYVSPELSQKIVKYQDPRKPSYHRWDDGAAMDVCFHREVVDFAPIYAAHYIDTNYYYSRMITYSESEWVCFATKLAEKDGKCRKKLYENRYMGAKKPKWVQYSENAGTRAKQKLSHELEHEWKGTGYPQYHGGGRKQFEHCRVSDYTHINDFLYDRHLVHGGIKNIPPMTDKILWNAWQQCAEMAGDVIDVVADRSGARVSITRAYNRTIDSMLWRKRYTLEFVPTVGYDIYDIADLVTRVSGVAEVVVSKHKEPRIQVVGEYI